MLNYQISTMSVMWKYNMGFGSETMMCQQFYAYDCDMNTYNHTFSEEYLLHVLSTMVTGLNVENKNIYINLLCFVLFFLLYQHSYLFLE